MDHISHLSSTSSSALIVSGILGAAIGLFTMLSLFRRKNHMPVEGRVCSPPPPLTPNLIIYFSWGTRQADTCPKTVLLTGASEGMGRSAAIQLAAKGAHVILVARNVGRLEEALADVRAAAASPAAQRFTYISADVAEPGYAERVVAEAVAWNGGSAPDIVWCVAGMSTPMLWTDEGAMAATRRNMDVNYFGAADMSHAVLRAWLAAPPPPPGAEPRHVVFTASVLAFFSIVGYGPYSPSKWALRGLADTLAMELNLYPDHPVRVHVVYPATITSPGLARENQTKPAITLELEKEEPPETPDTVARRAIGGLERRDCFVPVSFLGELMLCGVMGCSPRNSWILDTVFGWFVPLICFFVLRGMNAQVTAWSRKHGAPTMGGTK